MGACVHQPQLYEVCSPRIAVKMTFVFLLSHLHTWSRINTAICLMTFHCQTWPKANFDQISKFHSLKFWEINSIMWKYRESFHLNGHIIGFCPQTQKLESPYKTPPSTLAVKGLNRFMTSCIKPGVSGKSGRARRDPIAVVKIMRLRSNSGQRLLWGY